MVVIGLVVVIATLVIFPLSRDKGTRLAAGRQIAAEMVQVARAQAILNAGRGIDPQFTNDASAMLVINDDSTDWERYRRILGIVYYDAAQSGWLAGSPMVALPQGIYFQDAASSHTEQKSGLKTVHLDYLSSTPDTDLTQGGRRWYAYPFKSTGESLSSEARFILRSGYYNPKTLKWESNEPHVLDGFIIGKLGGIVDLQ